VPAHCGRSGYRAIVRWDNRLKRRLRAPRRERGAATTTPEPRVSRGRHRLREQRLRDGGRAPRPVRRASADIRQTNYLQGPRYIWAKYEFGWERTYFRVSSQLIGVPRCVFSHSLALGTQSLYWSTQLLQRPSCAQLGAREHARICSTQSASLWGGAAAAAPTRRRAMIAERPAALFIIILTSSGSMQARTAGSMKPSRDARPGSDLCAGGRGRSIALKEAAAAGCRFGYSISAALRRLVLFRF